MLLNPLNTKLPFLPNLYKLWKTRLIVYSSLTGKRHRHRMMDETPAPTVCSQMALATILVVSEPWTLLGSLNDTLKIRLGWKLWVGNVFGHVCVSVCVSICLSMCLSIQTVTFEPLDIGPSFLEFRYILTVSRSNLSIKVIWEKMIILLISTC